MANSSFKINLNKQFITLYGLRLFDMYQIDFGFMEESIVIYMFLRFYDKYASLEGYHSVIYWKLSYTTFGYSLYGVLFQ